MLTHVPSSWSFPGRFYHAPNNLAFVFWRSLWLCWSDCPEWWLEPPLSERRVLLSIFLLSLLLLLVANAVFDCWTRFLIAFCATSDDCLWSVRATGGLSSPFVVVGLSSTIAFPLAYTLHSTQGSATPPFTHITCVHCLSRKLVPLCAKIIQVYSIVFRIYFRRDLSIYRGCILIYNDWKNTNRLMTSLSCIRSYESSLQY